MFPALLEKLQLGADVATYNGAIHADDFNVIRHRLVQEGPFLEEGWSEEACNL
jgi:hypothetical protein